MSRIMLLDPPFFRFLNEDQRGVPLGISYLAGALKASGFEEVQVYNADFDPNQALSVCNRAYFEEMGSFEAYLAGVTDENHPIYRQVVSTVAGYRPDLIGISARTAKFYVTKTLIRLLRRELGEVPIVVGGPHASANAEHVLVRTNADFAVRGEGEHTIVELIETLNSGRRNLGTVNGISYRQNGSVVHNPPRALIENLDTIPSPSREAVIHSHMMEPSDFGNLFSSRGCPFSCTFCDARTTWSRNVRRHSPAYVVDQILDIKRKHGATFFSFQDDCFLTKEEHTIALCDEIRNRGLADLPRSEFRWWCEIHPRLINEKIVAHMKRAGCVALAIGAESGAQRTLSALNKASSLETIRNAARVIRNADLSLSVFFMIGFPWETEANIYETIGLMEELEPDNPTVSVLTPLPGTPIFEYCRERHLVHYDDDYLTLFHQRNAHFYSEHVSDERSKEIIREALERCDAVARRRRRDRIRRFVQHKVVPEVAARDGVVVNLVDEKRDVVPLLPNGTDMPQLSLAVDQNYADQQIAVEIAGPTDFGLASDFITRFAKTLLSEFPQYASVLVRETSKTGQRVSTILSNEIEQVRLQKQDVL